MFLNGILRKLVNKMKIFSCLCFIVLICACSQEQNANPQRELSNLTIGQGKNAQTFFVETSTSDEDMAKGLMFRKHLDANKGMIFIFKTPRKTAFWMKNTYIPLDMIFVDSSLKISGIVENVSPLSEKLIYSPNQTIAVIELNAGTVKKANIHKGMRITHPNILLGQN